MSLKFVRFLETAAAVCKNWHRLAKSAVAELLEEEYLIASPIVQQPIVGFPLSCAEPVTEDDSFSVTPFSDFMVITRRVYENFHSAQASIALPQNRPSFWKLSVASANQYFRLGIRVATIARSDPSQSADPLSIGPSSSAPTDCSMICLGSKWSLHMETTSRYKIRTMSNRSYRKAVGEEFVMMYDPQRRIFRVHAVRTLFGRWRTDDGRGGYRKMTKK